MDGIAERIRHARRDKNISQKELGKKLGITEGAISAYENNRAIPPLPTLIRISKITGFSLDFFTENKDKKETLETLKKDIKEIKEDISSILKILKVGHNE